MRSAVAVVTSCLFLATSGCGGGTDGDADTGSLTTITATGTATATATGMSGTDDGGTMTGGSTAGTTAGTGDGDGDAGDGDGTTPIPVCVAGCAIAADCSAIPGTAGAFDEDNYACDAGGCVYGGCNSDAECAASVPGTLCREVTPGGLRSCLYTCTSPADCDLGGGGAFDADNYACTDSVCEYLGCNSDAECQTTLPGYVCGAIGSTMGCFIPCSTSADCAMAVPSFDEDNYSCDNSLCVYTGCNSDAECEATAPGQVCR